MDKPSKYRARMQDVAKLAGVGTMSVSRYLRTPEAVAHATRKRVEEAIRATGFVANSAAGSLRSGTSPMVAAIVPTLRTSIVVDTLEGLERVLSDANYQLLIGTSAYDIDEEERLVRNALRWRPAGIMLAGLTHSEATVHMIKQAGVPLVEVWSVTESPRDVVVGVSNRDGAFRMVRSLVEWGYRRIAFAYISRKDNERSQQRFDGYRMAMQAYGLDVEAGMQREAENTYEAGAALVSSFRVEFPDLGAVFFGSDVLAVGAIMECHRRGWKVPEDIAIAGFDDLDIASSVFPSLTTVRTHRYDVGRRAAELLLGRIQGRITSPVVEALDVEVVRRASA